MIPSYRSRNLMHIPSVVPLHSFWTASKKIENHGHAVALYFLHYNFCRVHKTLRVTPAMEAGLANHVWTLEELVSLLDAKLEKVA